jgi:hypothetical protein
MLPKQVTLYNGAAFIEAPVTLSLSAGFLRDHEERQHAPTACTGGDFFRRMLLALTLCGLDSLRTAQKKRGAFASRCTMPKVQVLVMAATAATVKTSTAMEAFAAMKPSATRVLATAVAHGAARAPRCSMIEAAVSIIATRTTIGAMIVVRNVMVTAAPAMPVGTEMMVVAAIVANRSPTNEERRIETPAERAVEDSVSRNERVTAEVRIPIPTRAIPATHGVGLCSIDIGLRSIR